MNIIFNKNMKKGVRNLKLELSDLLHKKFNVCMQLKVGQLKQTHLLRRMRREVARIRFYLSRDC